MAKKKPTAKSVKRTTKEPEVEQPDVETEATESPDEVTTLRAENTKLKAQWAKVTTLEHEVADAAREVDDCKESLKSAKEHHDGLVVRLRNAIRCANDGQGTLPFPADETTEAWRDVTLDQLEITGKLAEHLTEAKLTTLGAIADYTASEKLLTDIMGIGAKAAEKIEAATADWWARNPGVKREEPPSDVPDIMEAAEAGK